MRQKNKEQLTAAQLRGLPISIGEAKKLLGAECSGMTDNEVAQKIIQLNELGRIVLRTLDLQ